MTLVVAAIDPADGSVSIVADSKITWDQDETRTRRRIYTAPAVKVLLLGNGIAVGYAGEGPDTIAAKVLELRGQQLAGVLDGLQSVSGADFVVATASPPGLWMVSTDGAEERTKVRIAWAGEYGAFKLFRARFEDFPKDSVASRMEPSLNHVVHLSPWKTVGGFVHMAHAEPGKEFRYCASTTHLFPGHHDPAHVAQSADGASTTVKLSFAEGPLELRVVPGASNSFAAVAFWVVNTGHAHLFADGHPDRCVDVHAFTPDELRSEASKAGVTLDAD
jgi:hypothetical protein